MTACGGKSDGDKKNSDGSKSIDKLSVGFVPSRDPEEIVSATDPLKNLLQEELKKEGYDVKNIDITVGTNFEAVGESLSSGTLDVGFIPGGTYVLYDDGAEVLLTATRAGLSIDSDKAKDWNDNKPTKPTDKQAESYRALMIAGPSSKGQALAKKVNEGKELSWEDVNGASWSVMSSSSPAGYIYPSLWMKENFDKNLSELKNIVQSDSYGSAFARLASGQVDVVLAYADARRDFEKNWTKEYNREKGIWDETNVIGVTPAIYNDTISVSKNSKVMDDDLKKALQKAFINIGKTEEGKKVIEIYSHEGYKESTSKDYDNERKAQKMIQESTKK
ncbi:MULTISPECIES: phosphate/phosphite/phosphonate ABC transporter substrate-binding protein [Vagococcus]|uniref:phosphate/phosphite/phosphonate ABC transporter substrate-binding protein n=1 Tax=Vagococcus sp. TaxID=1933889 RepID=UPI00211AFB73|nr:MULTISPECIES: phosphate/phosphite/phosphonate ABC transporter substrate-binding protein [Vagococcus]